MAKTPFQHEHCNLQAQNLCSPSRPYVLQYTDYTNDRSLSRIQSIHKSTFCKFSLVSASTLALPPPLAPAFSRNAGGISRPRFRLDAEVQQQKQRPRAKNPAESANLQRNMTVFHRATRAWPIGQLNAVLLVHARDPRTPTHIFTNFTSIHTDLTKYCIIKYARYTNEIMERVFIKDFLT